MNSSKIPIKKTKVKAVPDFAKLHQKWENRIRSAKPTTPKPTNSTRSSSVMERRPVASQPPAKLIATVKERQPRNSLNNKNILVLDKENSPRWVKSGPRKIKEKELPKALKQPLKAVQQRMTPLKTPTRPKRTIEFESQFDNSNLFEILNSTNTADLDKKSTAFDGRKSIRRLTNYIPPQKVENPNQQITRKKFERVLIKSREMPQTPLRKLPDPLAVLGLTTPTAKPELELLQDLEALLISQINESK